MFVYERFDVVAKCFIVMAGLVRTVAMVAEVLESLLDKILSPRLDKQTIA